MSKRPADSSSIAGQIASHRQLDRLAWNLCTDLLLVVFSVISWCAATEARFYDSFDPSLSRELLFDDTAGNFWDILATGVYNATSLNCRKMFHMRKRQCLNRCRWHAMHCAV